MEKDKGGMDNDINVTQIKLGPLGGWVQQGDKPETLYPIWLQEALESTVGLHWMFLKEEPEGKLHYTMFHKVYR